MISTQSFIFNAFQENTYVVYDETGDCLIIDPGCYGPAEEQALWNFISDNRLVVRLLVNTHCHIDHVIGNYFVKEKYQVDLVCHEKEDANLRSVKLYAPSYGFNHFHETLPDQFIREGEKIRFGDSELETLFVPGHSPGHIALLNREQKICFGGDVLFRNSIGRTDLPGGNHQDLLDSIRNKLFVLDDKVTVYPGHGPATNIGDEKNTNPFLKNL